MQSVDALVSYLTIKKQDADIFLTNRILYCLFSIGILYQQCILFLSKGEYFTASFVTMKDIYLVATTEKMSKLDGISSISCCLFCFYKAADISYWFWKRLCVQVSLYVYKIIWSKLCAFANRLVNNLFTCKISEIVEVVAVVNSVLKFIYIHHKRRDYCSKQSLPSNLLYHLTPNRNPMFI